MVVVVCGERGWWWRGKVFGVRGADLFVVYALPERQRRIRLVLGKRAAGRPVVALTTKLCFTAAYPRHPFLVVARVHEHLFASLQQLLPRQRVMTKRTHVHARALVAGFERRVGVVAVAGGGGGGGGGESVH